MAHDHSHTHDENCAHDTYDGPALTAVLEEIGPCQKLLKIEVSKDEVAKEVNERIREYRKNVHLKGYRPGKAPRSRIEQIYGKAIRKDTRDAILRTTYSKAIEDEIGERNLIGEGRIENVAFSVKEGLTYEVMIHTRPTFELPEYKGVEVEIDEVQIDEKEVDEAVDRFRASKGEVKPVTGDDAVVEGEDRLTVDVQVWMADEYETFVQQTEDEEETQLKPLKEESGLQLQLPLDRLGNYPVEDLADSLTGLKLGDWGEQETDLPMDFDVVEGRGEPAMLRIQIKSIHRMFLPELTEEWVKEAGQDSINDLRREIREELQQGLELARHGHIEDKVISKLLAEAGEFDLPGELVQQEVENATRRKTLELRYMEHLSEEDAEERVKAEADDLAKEIEQGVRASFVMEEIANKEEIKVGEADITARIAVMAAQRGQSPEALRQQLTEHKVVGQLYMELMNEKTRSFLRESAKVTEVDPDA
ncbi:MAG: trigger factor [Planctomycetes bacterium]|nr:trigger factor [Planctomycetota bacterium]